MAKRKPGAQNVPEPTKEQITGQTDLFEATHEAASTVDAARAKLSEWATQPANPPHFEELRSAVHAMEQRMTEQLREPVRKMEQQMVEQFSEQVLAMNRELESAEKTLDQALQSMIQTLNEAANRSVTAGLAESMKEIDKMAQTAMAGVTAFINSPAYMAITDSFQNLNEFVEEHRDEIEEALVAATAKKLDMPQSIVPFLLQELEELRADPQYSDCTVSDILKGGFDEDGNPTEEMEALLARAQASKEEYDKVAELAAAAERAARNLPLVLSVIPEYHTMPNNTLMNALEEGVKHDDGRPPTPMIGEPPFDLVVTKESGRRKEIRAYTMVSYDQGETGITITDAKLSEYERQVSDAIISLWEEAKKQGLPTVFTVDAIYRAMPGGSDKAPQLQKDAIKKTIEKFRRLHITVDATEEMQKRGKIGKGESFSFDNYYLSATRGEYRVKTGGQSVSAYRIDCEPIILTYSRMTAELVTVNAKYIEVKKVKNGHVSTELVTMTADRQAMIGYMLRRIAVMKRDKKNKGNKQKPVILFDSLFSTTGTATDNAQQASRNRKFCFEVMDYWKATGLIRDYKERKKGRRITAIDIVL